MKRALIITVIVLIAWGCDRNHPPVISGITCSPESRSAGIQLTLKALAADEDGDAMQYRWSADGGWFTDSINVEQTKWRSPVDGNGKTYTIKVMVSDGKLEAFLDYPIQLTEPVFGHISGYAYFNNCTIPVPGLAISLDVQSTITDTSGQFRFVDIPVGDYLLHAIKADFSSVIRDVKILPHVTVKITVSMTSDLYSSNVYGFVRDQDSLPISDAKVVMLNPDRSESKLIAYTNSAGYYCLWYVPVGQRRIIVRKVSNEDFGFEQVTLDMDITGPEFKKDIEMLNINLTGEFVDPRDKHKYLFKIIGTQTWMAENLAWLPVVYPSADGSDESKYYYVMGYEGSNADEARTRVNYTAFGVFYNWPAAMEGCPPGWHLPSDTEWKILENYLGPNAAFHLKSTTGWTNLRNGDNSSGFCALPAGERLDNIGFTGPGNVAHFWSTTLATVYGAWSRALFYSDNEFYRLANYKKSGYSVRCLKD